MEIDDFGDLGIGNLGDIDLEPLWLRRLAWDALPCEMVEDVQRALGLVPVGEDQQSDKDHHASHQRVAMVEDLSPAVEYMAPFLSKVLTRAIIMQLGEGAQGQVTDDVEHKLAIQNAEIIRSASLTIIAQFISTGVLEYVRSDRV